MHALPLPNSVPTDSILRRHFDQLTAAAGLPQAPQDSVLLRHYRQLLDARLDQAPALERPAAKASPPQAKAAPQPEARPVAPAAAAPAAAAPIHSQSTRDVASMPDRNPPPAPPTSWFSRLLARIFGN
jgi:hypothetical protein